MGDKWFNEEVLEDTLGFANLKINQYDYCFLKILTYKEIKNTILPRIFTCRVRILPPLLLEEYGETIILNNTDLLLVPVGDI